MHRNFSDLFSVIAELARLSKHSEWLINPLLFFALKNIKPLNTHLSPFVLVLYPRLRVQLYGYRRLRTRSRSSTAYGCPVYCILVQSAVPVSVPVVVLCTRSSGTGTGTERLGTSWLYCTGTGTVQFRLSLSSALQLY